MKKLESKYALLSRKTAKLLVLLFFTIISFSFFGHGDAWADQPGGFVDLTPTAPPSTGGGGGKCFDKYGNRTETGKYAVQCTGYSWMFYQTRLANGQSQAVIFRPAADSVSFDTPAQTVEIPAECSAHEGGGVWIFGSNAMGMVNKYGWAYPEIAYFGNFSFVNGTSSTNDYTYSTSNNLWGHAYVFSYGNSRVYDYSYYGSTSTHKTTEYGHTDKSGYNDQVSHILYYKNEPIYTAVRMDGVPERGDENDKNSAWYHFLQAWKYTHNGQEYDIRANGRDYPDSLRMFCYWPGMDQKYSGKSDVSMSEVGSSSEPVYKTTGVVSSYTNKVATMSVKVGSEVSIVFSHNAYSTEEAENIQWSIAYVDAAGSNYTLKRSMGVHGNTANFKIKEGDKYVGVPANTYRGQYRDNNGSYATRDVYKVTLNKFGVYMFCQRMYVNSTLLTNVCATITVGPQPPTKPKTPPCDFTTGTTDVKSKVINPRRDGEEWLDETYAKPDDTVWWHNCYSPGAQAFAHKTVSGFTGPGGSWNGDGGEGGCSNTTNATKTMTQAYRDVSGHAWTNDYLIKTNSPFRLNNNCIYVEGGNCPKIEDLLFEKPWTGNAGDTAVRTEENNYVVDRVGVIGKTFTDTISTNGTPIMSSWGNDGRGYHPWTACCGCCPCKSGCCGCCTVIRQHTNLYNVGSASDGKKTATSSVKIPFNYTNSASISVSNDVIYSGEKVNVNSVQVVVGKRDNGVVKAEYATQVGKDPDGNKDVAKVQLVAWVTDPNDANTTYQRDYAIIGPNSTNGASGEGNSNANLCDFGYIGQSFECRMMNEYPGGILNKAGELDGVTYNNTVEGTEFTGDYNAFDARAGDYMCMAVGVYPAASAPNNSTDGDKNLNKNGNNSWYISKPACRRIAKEPSFQIVGGSGLYSVKSVEASVSNKRNTLGVFGYTLNAMDAFLPQSDNNAMIYGSWVEQLLNVSGGGVKNVASAAGLGKSTMGGGYGQKGLMDTVFCINDNMVALTIANRFSESNNCQNGSVGFSGIEPPTNNIAALADYWGEGASDGVYNGVNLNYDVGKEVPSGTGKNIRVIKVDSDLAIGESYIDSNKTRVVKAAGDVYINGDIMYHDGSYSSSSEIPKVVIYAKNIYIACNFDRNQVKRIDAALIAEGVIDTCSDSGDDDVNDRNRSVQLLITGFAIAKQLKLKRTYGNTMGIGSGTYYQPATLGSETPAEIINYDTSLLIWGNSMASAEESDTMTVTYQHELAPRY